MNANTDSANWPRNTNGWIDWYMDRMKDPPRSRAHAQWIRTSVKAGVSKENKQKFYEAVVGKSPESTDQTSVRYGHLFLLLLQGRVPSLLLRSMGFRVRTMRTHGAVGVGSYALEHVFDLKGKAGLAASPRANPALLEARDPNAGPPLVSEEDFRTILAQVAHPQLAVPTQKALALGLHLMYYCGLSLNFLAKATNQDVFTAGESMFMWGGNRLITIPAHVIAHWTYTDGIKGKLFSTSTCRMLRPYAYLYKTVDTLRSLRG